MDIEQTQALEAANLERLFKGVNQAAFARDHSVPGGPSMLNQHIKGRRPIGLAAGLAYAKGLGVELSAISPRLAKQADHLRAVATENAEDADRLKRHLEEVIRRRAGFEVVLDGATHSGPERERLTARLAEWKSVEDDLRQRLGEHGNEYDDPLGEALWRVADTMREVPREKRGELAALLSALAVAPDSKDLLQTILELLMPFRPDR